MPMPMPNPLSLSLSLSLTHTHTHKLFVSQTLFLSLVWSDPLLQSEEKKKLDKINDLSVERELAFWCMHRVF